jgi:hypothetical protein
MIMRKVFVVLVLTFIFFSCDNDDMNKETNPYPDGVYPFEVSNVGHNSELRDVVVSWDNPADSGFKSVSFELFALVSITLEWELIFTSDGENPQIPTHILRDPVLGVNKFSMFYDSGGDLKAVIKCVDKFGNVSGGVEYNFNPYH